MSFTDRLDAYQRRHSWLGFPIAAVYKFYDDRGPYLAALVTYYGFVSLFPLLLLFFSVAGFVLQSDPSLQRELEQSALRNFPVIGPQLQHNVQGFHGSGVALAVGILGTLYGGLGVMQAAQAAFNQIYGVPRNEQPNPFKSRLRSLGLLGLLGAGVLLTTAIAAAISTANGLSRHIGPLLQVVGYLLTFGLNVVLFTGAFELLTALDLRFRNVVRGGLIAGGFWTLLQTEGSALLSRELNHAGELYGTFGLVLAAMAWIYLQSMVLMLSAEINVVVQFRLWPRSLLTPFTDNVELTDADRRVYDMYATAQRFKGFEKVTTDFEAVDDTEPATPRGASPPAERSAAAPATSGSRPPERGTAAPPPSAATGREDRG